MSLATSIRPFVRTAVPWLAAAILLQLCLRTVWPSQILSARSDSARAESLRLVVPDPTSLRALADSLERDSTELADRAAAAARRTISSSDPGAELASRLVPILASRGWKLQKVKAEGQAGWAVLELGAETDFPRAMDGLRQIRTAPWALQVRRIALRPGPGGRLQLDLQVASPTGRKP